ncbi:prepilin-type N-terminal cleavage/methylation domain-containing protein [Singulisphaera sp. Ch08]|uniref:Prepilin-type N-terminal cleavage/methylation domain-containing protein n=1 Tax=Singulisphaera sp. Ch08 TaxID=3120278 RepID=A0AAU7CRL8_9BACT
MILRTPRGRSGITLTEILISILILGIGMVSLATLFPLGLLRLRDANRLSRSATLTESATADTETRDLLNKSSFLNSNYSPWYTLPAYTPWPYDPWVQDTPSFRGDPIQGPAFGAYRGTGAFNTGNVPPHDKPAPALFIPGPGLPVAYDPLWRQQTSIYPGVLGQSEARFASGIGFVRPDPDGAAPSAHGLQRLTNFTPFLPAINPRSNSVPSIFVSPEDMVLQSDKDSGAGANALSPIVPDMSFPPDSTTQMLSPQYDWNYTWMFTGQQADCTNGSVFVGDIVVFEKRPFAVDPTVAPFDSNITSVVAGETVVEAIFGYTGRVTVGRTGASRGYGSTANRAVLLRWSDKMPDPEIKVGNWIADVTYERNAIVDYRRRITDPDNGNVGDAGAYYPYQRCHWYQIAKRTEAGPGQAFAGDPPTTDVTYREMTVWVSTPLRALTLLSNSSTPVGSPVHVNAALVSPYVVNVFPRTIYTR